MKSNMHRITFEAVGLQEGGDNVARKQQKIKVISEVMVDGKWVEVNSLNEEQRERLAIGLKVTYLNALFAGRAEFSAPPGFEIKNVDGKIAVTRVPAAAETA